MQPNMEECITVYLKSRQFCDGDLLLLKVFVIPSQMFYLLFLEIIKYFYSVTGSTLVSLKNRTRIDLLYAVKDPPTPPPKIITLSIFILEIFVVNVINVVGSLKIGILYLIPTLGY